MPELVSAAIDPTRSNFILCVGRKGSGKSYLASRFWSSWPFDKFCVDPTHDALVGDEVELVHEPLPATWPWRHDEKPSSLHFVPNPASPTYEDDLDRAVALLWTHPKDLPVLGWLDESGEHAKGAHTPPAMRRVLHQGRHRKISLLMCCPRPMDIDPLMISQADWVYVFNMPHPRDKDRLAANMGLEPKQFAAGVDALGEHEYLRFETSTHDLVHFPPLPTSGSAAAPPEHGSVLEGR